VQARRQPRRPPEQRAGELADRRAQRPLGHAQRHWTVQEPTERRRQLVERRGLGAVGVEGAGELATMEGEMARAAEAVEADPGERRAPVAEAGATPARKAGSLWRARRRRD
jgi:hypothetical protein